MKKIYALMAIVAILLASNCSRIPENNDPVIGIWSKVAVMQSQENGQLTVRQEWIFNDVYLGRYQRYEGKTLTFKTDFKWTTQDGIYTVSYPGTDMPKVQVVRKDSPEGEVLEDTEGEIIASRE